MIGNLSFPHLNLAFAWVWIFLGFASGALMGMRFKNENWLGGYASFPRRLIRLGHISFLGLGLINFLFFFTVHALGVKSAVVDVAAWAFLVGGVLIPVCCAIMAFWKSARPVVVFAAPVTSLLLGGALTVYLILKP